MDRIIEVKVGGNHLKKDSKNAGVRGEGNVAHLRIAFDEGWDGYEKEVTFWDARGGNPVKRILTIDLLENIAKSKRIYLVPIPAEPMVEAGMMTFVIDGYENGKRQRTISDQLEVKYSPIAENASEPVAPTPDEVEQIQGQIEEIIDTIQDAYQAQLNARESADEAKASEETAKASSNQAKEYAGEAGESAEKALSAVGKVSYIGANGNWFAWDNDIKAWYDTMVKAQAGSTVYVGDNPPDDAEVWIDPNGESAIYAPYIGENGNWYTFNPETQTFTDSGHKASPETIEFDNGVRLESREDGIYFVHTVINGAGEEEEEARQVFDNYNSLVMADESYFSVQADYANMDGNGNPIHSTYATKKEVETKIKAYVDEAILGGAW